VLDTVRAQSLSLHGYERPTTPQLERLAKTGVCFDRAISTSPWTLPSHASMFTGRWPYELSADWQTPLDNTYPTLAEVLSKNGYLTAGFAANTFYCSYEYGLSRGFAHYEDYRVSPGQAILYSTLGRTLVKDLNLEENFATHENFGRKSAAQLNSDFLDWLSSKRDDRPFFTFLNYNDAHPPWYPPEEFAPTRPRGYFTPEIANALDHRQLGRLENAYDGTIGYLDHHIGRLFDELAARDRLENTLVMIVSDHGEQFGEHGLTSHGNSLYLELIHVPLLVIFPGRIPGGHTVSQPVTLRDLAATVIDLIGLEKAMRFPGRSLAHHLTEVSESARPEEETLFSHVNISWDVNKVSMIKGQMSSLISNGMHYIKNPDGREELYDIQNDPGETQDLAGLEEEREVLKVFRSSLKSMPGLTLAEGPSNG
jgi:arylsulfatase A-like enzyme